MAHHQPQVETLECVAIGGDLLDISLRHAQSRHATVDLHRDRQPASATPAPGIAPGSELFGAVGDRRQPLCGAGILRPRMNTVQDEYLCAGAKHAAKRLSLAGVGDEERIAAFLL